MRFQRIAAAAALAAAFGLTLASADAAPRKRVVIVEGRGQTVYTYTDEYGRRHTRVIIQRRSYLDPGTESFPGERSVHDYAHLPTQHPTRVLDNTPAGSNQTALPGPFTLPSRNNPWLQY
jgi:hypothetical protein